MSNFKTEVVKDFPAKTIRIIREFAAPIEVVWRAFTEPALLDQWWGPQPWRAETHFMDFREGGHWLYVMISPDDQQRHFGRMNYISIRPHQGFTLQDVFCDENGNTNTDLPMSNGQMTFTATASGTRVQMTTTYENEAMLQTVVEMGFEAGITICMEQLAVVLTQL